MATASPSLRPSLAARVKKAETMVPIVVSVTAAAMAVSVVNYIVRRVEPITAYVNEPTPKATMEEAKMVAPTTVNVMPTTWQRW